MRWCASPTRTARPQIAGAGDQGRRPAGRPAQSSLDQEHHRQPRRHEALCDGRLEQQRRRERHGRARRAAPRSGRSISRPASSALFASGLRNPNGMAWEPQTGALWTVVNERDELGSDLVPDYMTSVQDGALLRLAVQLLRPARRRAREAAATRTWSPRRIVPDYALGAHTALARPRLLTAARCCRSAIASGAFVGQHGSWNRKPRSGYKVIFVPFADGKPCGAPVDVLTGFVNDDGEAHGPPGRRRGRSRRRAARRRRRRQRDLAGRAGRGAR